MEGPTPAMESLRILRVVCRVWRIGRFGVFQVYEVGAGSCPAWHLGFLREKRGLVRLGDTLGSHATHQLTQHV